MFFKKLYAIALFFSVIASTLFSVQELKNDGSIIPGAVFFTIHTGNRCVLHQAFGSGTIQYEPSDCTENSIIKHEDGRVFISYHDGSGKIIGFIEVKVGQEELSYAASDRLDPQAKPQVFMVFIVEDLGLRCRDIFFEGYGGEILSDRYKGKTDINDPDFKEFGEKLDLTKIKDISELTFSKGDNDFIIQ